MYIYVRKAGWLVLDLLKLVLGISLVLAFVTIEVAVSLACAALRS